ncbi:MAG TPA: M1 family aminopeptidase [Vicinamibacterales bacterium]|nr:M1 family aminopeptidase [Vicinamibacterales bacterium]
MRWLLVLAFVSGWASSSSAQTAQPDPVAPLLRRFELALNQNDRPALTGLFSPDVANSEVELYLGSLLLPGAVKATVRLRDRSPLEGAPLGDGYSLVVEFFLETPGRARILTASMDMRRPPGGDLSSWKFVGAAGLTFVEGLYKLRIDKRPLTARNLEITSEDLVLQLSEGTVFRVECDDGVTGLILLGRGVMTFSPTAAAERGQLRLFAGSDTLNSPFESAFVRLSPSDYNQRVSATTLTEAAPDARQLRRAEEVFAQNATKSFNVDLQDLSSDDWYLLPPLGDFLAEVDTRRFDTLTYTLTAEQAEDISVFRRKDRLTLSLYASVGKLAARGRFYSDDALRDYDVLDYSVEAYVDPERNTLRGRARLLIRVRSTSVSTLRLRLAETLAVSGVTSVEYGRLLHLRIRSQNTVVVNLPRIVVQDSDLTLVITYAGPVLNQELDSDTIALAPDAQEQAPVSENREPAILLSNRAYWYPQNPVPDYATASLRIFVPPGFTCVASGHPVAPSDIVSLRDILAGQEGGPVFAFRADQPLRYLALVVSRLVRIGDGKVVIENQTDPGSGVDSIAVSVVAQNSLRGQSRQISQETQSILQFYSSLMGDAPYTSATVALLEGDLPGGHSPGYFAVLNTPPSFATVNWRGDPASFEGFPQFFLAHELAHQWWGQAIGWKNYHEQWISEGFAQYFAALYAQRSRGDRVFFDMLRQFRRWSLSDSDQGPVHLGSRLGHVKRDPRVFRALVYNKGAAVLHMLRRLLGDEVFFRGLRRFYMDRRYQKAGTEDFERAMEAASGRVLDRFFERWIYGSGIPRVRYGSQIGDKQVIVKFEQAGDQVFDIPVTVTLTYADGRTSNVVVPVSDSQVERSIPTDGPVRRVQINQDSAALAEFVEG